MLVRTRQAAPFRDLNVLRTQLDELFDHGCSSLFDGADSGETIANWAPAMDVIETGDSVVLRAELPGLTDEDVEISVEDNTLSLKGEKKSHYEDQEGSYRRVESRYGSFYRSFSLPNSVDQDKIDAQFAHGVLEITLPKVEKAKPKKIAVKAH